MLTRRRLIAAASAAAATTLASGLAAPALAQPVFRIPREWLPTDVRIATPLAAGSIYADIAGTWLFLGVEEGWARRYKTAVGAAGRNLSGAAYVGRKAEWPSWVPTASMIRMEPEVYGPFAGGLPGGHEMNPLGARALYLYRGGRDTMYRIHGTPQPWTIGQSFSSGCIRMMNDHAVDLYDRVPVGAPVFAA